MSHLTEQLSALVDGELTGAELDRVNAHLAGCAGCRSEAAALRQLKRTLRALGQAATEEDANPALTQRLLALAGPGGPVPSRRQRRMQYRAGRRPRAARRPLGDGERGPRDGERGPRRGRGRYLAWSMASLMVVGLGTAAFGMGGGAGGGSLLEMQISPQLRASAADAGGQAESARNPGPSGRQKALVAARRQLAGMRLLGKAAAAGRATSYQGTEVLSAPAVNGGDVMTVTQVSHAPGDSSGNGDGVFGITSDLVALLGKHYLPLYQGSGVSAGRAALVVEVHRFDGSLAARFWLDRQTLLPLRRELYDTASHLVSEDAFIQVRFGGTVPRAAATARSALALPPGQVVRAAPGPPGAPPAPAAPVVPAAPAATLWAKVASPLPFLATLRRSGWQLPGAAVGGLSLYTAARSPGHGTDAVDLGYSDGLFVVSLLARRGTLTARPAGWLPASLNGRQVYLSGHSVLWNGAGIVYTVTADAPPQTVAAVIAALPEGGTPGLLGRFGRGLDRLAALANPFA